MIFTEICLDSAKDSMVAFRFWASELSSSYMHISMVTATTLMERRKGLERKHKRSSLLFNVCINKRGLAVFSIKMGFIEQ